MKIYKSLAIASAVTTLMLSGSVYALGVEGDFKVVSQVDDGNLKIYAESSTTVKASSSKGEMSATGSKERTENANSNASFKATSTASSSVSSTKGDMGAEHRSVVATFVHSLLNVAGKGYGIGEQVRVIAEAQSSSSASTSDAIAKVENRNSVAIFLLGNDYSSLNKIRNEIKATEKRIADLETLVTSTWISMADKVEVEAQLTVLKADQVKLEAYVKAHEDEFSVFGWFTKLFVK